MRGSCNQATSGFMFAASLSCSICRPSSAAMQDRSPGPRLTVHASSPMYMRGGARQVRGKREQLCEDDCAIRPADLVGCELVVGCNFQEAGR